MFISFLHSSWLSSGQLGTNFSRVCLTSVAWDFMDKFIGTPMATKRCATAIMTAFLLRAAIVSISAQLRTTPTTGLPISTISSTLCCRCSSLSPRKAGLKLCTLPGRSRALTATISISCLPLLLVPTLYSIWWSQYNLLIWLQLLTSCKSKIWTLISKTQ